MPYKLSTQAEIDLEEILIFGIQTFGKSQALKYFNSFKNVFELLSYIPEIGRRIEPDKDHRERRFLHGRHVIFYSIDAEYILIRTIIHGSLL